MIENHTNREKDKEVDETEDSNPNMDDASAIRGLLLKMMCNCNLFLTPQLVD